MGPKQMGRDEEAGFTAIMRVIHGWAKAEMERGLASGVPLDEAGIRLARLKNVEHPEKVRICRVDRVPHPRALLEQAGNRGAGISAEMMEIITQWMSFITHAPGLTLGYVVFVNSRDEGLLGHELVHVGQTEREGGLEPFLTAYVREALMHGYRNNRFEVEAYGFPGEDA